MTDDEFTEIVDARIDRVDLVGKAANGMSFLLAKSADTRTPTPADIAAILNRKAHPMTATVEKDVDLDPTEVLAEPDGDMPGDPNEPGSPAWEAIDAATAMKWTAILSRALNALQVMADREAQEAVTADTDDAGSVWDLEDAQCAIDYAISVLAPFAAGEASEAELGAEALDGITKAVQSVNLADLDVVEGYAPIIKAGRVLSSANESKIRQAVTSLQSVLDNLPEPVTKTKEPAMSENTTDDAAADVAKADAPVEPEAAAVVKADEPQMQAVYDAKGNLVGVVDPEQITPLAGAGSSDDGDGDSEPAPAEPAADADPTAPAHPDDVGTAADAPAADADGNADAATKGTPTVVKSEDESAIEAAISKSTAPLVEEIEVLKAEVARLTSPAKPRVLANGVGEAGPLPRPAHLRGLDRAATPADTSPEAHALRERFEKAADSTEQAAIAEEMAAAAAAALHEVQHGAR